MKQFTLKESKVICPYCNKPARLADTKEIYKTRSYGKAYICVDYPGCDSYVGVHNGTDKPKGRMANAELRAAKIKAHAAFDPIWRERFRIKSAQDKSYTKGMARNGKYKKLSQILGIPRDECHIGMFDIDTCNRVIAICNSGVLNDKDLRPCND